MRSYGTGGVRSELGDKLQYEGYFSPMVLRRRAQYMKKHQEQEDGEHREPDNWQNGMPMDDYIDSLFRHFIDIWLNHREVIRLEKDEVEELLCAMMFNCEGYLFELMKGTPPPIAEEISG